MFKRGDAVTTSNSESDLGMKEYPAGITGYVNRTGGKDWVLVLMPKNFNGHDGAGIKNAPPITTSHYAEGRMWWFTTGTLDYVQRRNPPITFGSKSQNGKLLAQFNQGRKVTRLTAMHYGIQNLTARISDLRNAGYDIVCNWQTDMEGNRYGEFELAA